MHEQAAVVHNGAHRRYELTEDGETAFLTYDRTVDALTLLHTEVPPALRGRHLGGALVEAAATAARHAGLRIVAVCPFARDYLRRHNVEKAHG